MLSDIIESKLIFFTGAPGSKWSAVSNVITSCSLIPFNKSDRSEDREYNSNRVQHKGSYWGPGMEFGKRFHELNKLSKQEFIEECIKPFSESLNGYLLIKSHVFAYHLKYLQDNFPLSKIMVVNRPPNESFEHWKAAGSFNIRYPNYLDYYKNLDQFKKFSLNEIQHSRQWIKDNDLPVYIANSRHFKDFWNIELSSENYSFIKSIEQSLDVSVTYYNFDDIFFITR